MTAVKNDINCNLDFAVRIMGELASYPYVIIKDYRRMGINEKELAVLLRILHPYFAKGKLTLGDVASEFGVTDEEAKVILQPFLDKGLLKSGSRKSYSCEGVLNCYYEEWICEQRKPKTQTGAVRSAGNCEAEKQLIRDLAGLYRRFEQELGKNLTPMQSEEIRSWLEKDGMPAEMIEEALRRSILQEKRSFAYIKSILKKWRDAGYKELREVLENDTKPAKSKSRAGKKNTAGKSKYAEIYDKY
ncbi:MAG: DnaD domain protein [Solobacterium sp.]|nr:DnaD domain protein [Solobacterium sp.]